jgi:hypothetical protein
MFRDRRFVGAAMDMDRQHSDARESALPLFSKFVTAERTQVTAVNPPDGMLVAVMIRARSTEDAGA